MIEKGSDGYEYELIANWSDGTVLAAQSRHSDLSLFFIYFIVKFSSPCIVLNILPPSSDSDDDFWPAPAKGTTLTCGPARLFCNALLICSKKD